MEAIPVTASEDEVALPRVVVPRLAIEAKRFVLDAVVAKKLVEVAEVVVERSAVKRPSVP